MNFVFTKHALEQLEARNISIEIVNSILNQPQQIVQQEEATIYQSIINFKDGNYLVRVVGPF